MSDKLRFGEILVRAGVLPRSALESVLERKDAQRFDIGELLVLGRLIDENTMLTTISTALNLPRIDLRGVTPEPRALQLVPREFCVEHNLLPVEVERNRTGEHLHVAMANPSDVRAIKRVTRQARLRIRPLVAAAPQIRAGIVRYYGGTVDSPDGATTQPLQPVLQRGGADSVQPSASAPPVAAQGMPEATGADLFDFGAPELGGMAFDPSPSPEPQPSAPPVAPPIAPLSAPPQPVGAESPGLRRSSTGARRRRDDDFAAALQDADSTSSMGTSDLSRSGTKRSVSQAPPIRRRAQSARFPTPRPSTGPLPIASGRRGGQSRPVPAAPPSLTGTRPPSEAPPARSTPPPIMAPPSPPPGAAGPAASSVPPPIVRPPRPGTLPPPFNQARAPDRGPMPPLPRTSTQPDPPSSAPAPPMPAGMIDDVGERDISGVLQRYMDEVVESREGDDRVIADYLAHFGPNTTGTADPTAALQTAVAQATTPTSRLLLTLVHQLAQRGLIDLEALLGRRS